MANAMSSTTTYCTACSRCFVDRSAIEAHYRDSPAHVGLWCQRCERHFAQVADRNQHIENSNSHWVCARLSWTDRPCSFDGYSHKSLHNHWTESGHHKFCEECNLDYLTSAQLHQHGLEAVSKAFGGLVFGLLTRTVACNFKSASICGPRTLSTFNNTCSA